MPNRVYYKQQEPLERQFAAMSDEEFLRFAESPEMEELYRSYSPAQKTAFLIRSLMVGEDSAAFEKDVLESNNCVVIFGPEELSEMVDRRQSINDPYADARAFHYDVYRELLYNDSICKNLADVVEEKMSARNMFKNAGRLREILFGHLTVPRLDWQEDPDAAQQKTKPQRDGLLEELKRGEHSYQPTTAKASELREATEPEKLPEVVLELRDGSAVTVRLTDPPEGQSPEALLDCLDDPEAGLEQKLNGLLSYVFNGIEPRVEPKAAARQLEALRKNDTMKGTLQRCAEFLSKREILNRSGALLRQFLTEGNVSLGGRLDRIVTLAKKQAGKLSQEEQQQENYRIIPEDNPYAKEREARERKQKEAQQAAEQKNNDIDRMLRAGVGNPTDRYGRSWSGYGDIHRPQPGRRYSHAEQEELLSKLMVARWMQRTNGAAELQPSLQKAKTAFNLKTARSYAEKLRESPAFRGLAATGQLKKYLTEKPDRELSDCAPGFLRPFNHQDVSFEQRQRIFETLKEMAPYLTPAENRSPEWQRFQQSVNALTRENFRPRDNDNPAENGENKLNEIFKNAIDYMKGKKSLRRHEDQQNRFDQALDVMVEISKVSPYAKLAADGVIHRIDEVRRKHDRDHINLNADSFGRENIGHHSEYQAPNPEAELRAGL